MRKLAIVWIFIFSSCAAWSARRVSVDQLNHWIATTRGKADGKIAGELNDLELTQRLSAARLVALESSLPGPASRRALVALADQAVFLDPPPIEDPMAPAPDANTQRQILLRAVAYVHSTIERLPNFYATRDTIRFADSPAFQDVSGAFTVSGTFIPYKPLHPVSRSKGTVLYSDGKETVQTEEGGQAQAAGLTTSGEFGPILLTVLGDVREDNITWHHWEQGAGGPRAVFRYSVVAEKSHYHVQFCCVAHALFRKVSGYHGELAIDPRSGTILRLTAIADMDRNDPVVRADIMVEYGPIELGQQTYLCPAKSVSIFRAPMESGAVQTPVRVAGMMNGPPVGDGGPRLPLQTMLNEVVFEDYHLFRADVRILEAGDAAPASAAASVAGASLKERAPATAPASIETAESEPESHGATASEGAVAPPATPAGETSMTAAEPSSPANSAPAVNSEPTASAEISVVGEPDLTERPSPGSASGPPASATLRVSTRLVNVALTAYDKKGNPLLDLKPEEVELFDNGHKQRVGFFGRLSAATGTEAAAGGDAGTDPDEFSNRLGSEDATSPEKRERSSIVLLMDASSIDFADLTYAREQVLKFVGGLGPEQCAGLYTRTASSGFKVLMEPTCDHAAVAGALRKWTPSAVDLAAAREVEQRNRQQMDDVHSATDMESVNGNLPGSGAVSVPRGGAALQQPPSMTSDPKLGREGRDPGRDALTSMVLVAMHLAALPGHKSLVWIASDNVLANWSDQSAGKDKGGNTPNKDILQAQEFLNDAQVTIYPMDVSQLEAASTNASLQNENVELEQSVKQMTPTAAMGDAAPNAAPGRATAEMRQNLRPIQPAIQQMAEATGGRVYRRSGDLAANLNHVLAENRGAYLLGFSPDTQPDDAYHRITIKVTTRHGAVLRYRAGYVYSKEPVTLKERFRQAVWQPYDAGGIALRAHVNEASNGKAISLRIAANDLGIVKDGDRWTDKLDIFLVQRDASKFSGKVKGQTLVVRAEQTTYDRLMRDGVPFNEFVEQDQLAGTIRIIVVDENTGRMGSITLPEATL
jgi:VWFA-related protein